MQQLIVPPKVRVLLVRAEKDFSARKEFAALKELNGALRDDPTCAPAFTMRALIELATKDVQNAILDAKQAAALDPNDAHTFLALATAQNMSGDPDAARTAAEQALRLQPGLWQARLEIAKALYHKEQFAAALHQLALLKVDFPDVHLVRGDVLMMMGHREEGSEEFKTFLLEAPRDSRVDTVGKILAQSGQLPSIAFAPQR